MKGLIILIVVFWTTFSSMYSQSLHNKYWNYKNRLNSKFVRVGGINGESIPASTRSIGNAHSRAAEIDGLKPSRIYFTDATIYLGHYISSLALEYKLLTVSGQDRSNVLNEIFYAVNAINRLDYSAESYLDYQNSVNSVTLNGFLLRDDVPLNHFQNYQNDYSITFNRPALLIKSHSDYDPLFYYTPTPLNTFNGDNWSEHFNADLSGYGDYENFDHGINKGNVMSQDQVITLLTGLRAVYDFVDYQGLVQPTPNDLPINPRDEARAIVERILKYIIRPNPQCDNCFDFVILGPDGKDVHTGANMTLYAPMLLKLAEHFDIDLGISPILKGNSD